MNFSLVFGFSLALLFSAVVGKALRRQQFEWDPVETSLRSVPSRSWPRHDLAWKDKEYSVLRHVSHGSWGKCEDFCRQQAGCKVYGVSTDGHCYLRGSSSPSRAIESSQSEAADVWKGDVGSFYDCNARCAATHGCVADFWIEYTDTTPLFGYDSSDTSTSRKGCHLLMK